MLNRRFRYTRDTLQSYHDAIEASSSDKFRDLLRAVNLSHRRLYIQAATCNLTLNIDGLVQLRTEGILRDDQSITDLLNEEIEIELYDLGLQGFEASTARLRATVMNVDNAMSRLTLSINYNDKEEVIPLPQGFTKMVSAVNPDNSSSKLKKSHQMQLRQVKINLMLSKKHGDTEYVDRLKEIKKELFTNKEAPNFSKEIRSIFDNLFLRYAESSLDADNIKFEVTQCEIRSRTIVLNGTEDLNPFQRNEQQILEMFANYSVAHYERNLGRDFRSKKRFINGLSLIRHEEHSLSADPLIDKRLLDYELRDHMHGSDYWKRKATEIAMKYMLLTTEVERRPPKETMSNYDCKVMLFEQIQKLIENYESTGSLYGFKQDSFKHDADVLTISAPLAEDRFKLYMKRWAGWFTSEVSVDAHILSAGIRVLDNQSAFCKLMGIKVKLPAESGTPEDATVPAHLDVSTLVVDADEADRTGPTPAEREFRRRVDAYNFVDANLTSRGLNEIFRYCATKGLYKKEITAPLDADLLSYLQPSYEIRLTYDPLLPLLRHCGFHILDENALVVPMMVNLRGHNAEFAGGRVFSATLMMLEHPQLLRGTALYERCKSMVRSTWRLQTGYEEGMPRRKFRRVKSSAKAADPATDFNHELFSIVADSIMTQFHALFPPGKSIDAPTRFRLAESSGRLQMSIEALVLCDQSLFPMIDVLLSPSESSEYRNFCEKYSFTDSIDCGILRLRPVFPSKEEEMHHLETLNMVYSVPTFDLDESGFWYIGAELDDFMEGIMMHRKSRR